MAKISKEEFKALSEYIYKLTGIDLDESKDYLVETRLNPVLISYGLQSFSELYYKAKSDKSGELEKKIVDGISTNETLFFRDNTPFEQLKYRIVPDLLDKKQKQGTNGKIKLDIWSAACSNGQEVYSIAISLLEVLEDINKYEISILGTDISQQALAQASYGKYNKLEIERGMPQSYLNKYFHPVGDGWRINDYIRSMVKFQKLNLMDSFSGLGSFDIIFCRNVAIYFSHADKRKLFQKLARVLKSEGYLLVGGSESLSGLAPEFESKHYLKGIYYQLKSAKTGSADKGQPEGNKDVGTKPAPREVSPPGQGVKQQPEPNKGKELTSEKPKSAANSKGSSQRAETAAEGKRDQPPKPQQKKQEESSVSKRGGQASANKGEKSLLANLKQRKGKESSYPADKKEKSQGSLLTKLTAEKERKKK